MKRAMGFGLLMLASLGVAIYCDSVQRQHVNESWQEATTDVGEFRPADINWVRIIRGSGDVVLERRGEWELVEPWQAHAAQDRVVALVRQLANLQGTRRLDEANRKPLRVFGLEKASETVEFSTSTDTHTLHVGEASLSGADVYAQLDNQPGVLMLPDGLVGALNWTADEWRDHTVLNAAFASASGLHLVAGSLKLTLSKTNGVWRLAGSAPVAINQDSVVALLERVRLARVVRFISSPGGAPDNISQYGLDRPRIRLTVTAGDGPSKESATLEIGAKNGVEYFARDIGRPFIFTVDAELYKTLRHPWLSTH
jgi:hypothetical protein